jgi:hypothetical protein
VAACAGVAMAVRGLGTQLGLRESPVLRMTILDCVEVPSGKSSTTDCEGGGDPGKSGVTSGLWKIDDADSHYAFNTVVNVRCTPSGDCTAVGLGGFAEDLAGLALCLLFVSVGGFGCVTSFVNMFFPARLDRVRRWPGRRATTGWVGLLGAMFVTAIVLAVLS